MAQRVTPQDEGVVSLPLVPLRDIVVFPQTMVPFVVGRKASLLAVEQALAGDKRLFLSTQCSAQDDEPSAEDINAVGTTASIVQHLKLGSGNVKLLVEGSARARVVEIEKEAGGQFRVRVRMIECEVDVTPELRKLMTRVGELFERFIKYSPGLPQETMLSTVRIAEPGRLGDTIAAHLPVGVEEKQALLESTSPGDRLEKIAGILEIEIEKLRMDTKIHNRVKSQMERAQKEYYLNEKMKAIQEELGRRDDRINENEEFRKKIEQAKMPADA